MNRKHVSLIVGDGATSPDPGYVVKEKGEEATSSNPRSDDNGKGETFEGVPLGREGMLCEEKIGESVTSSKTDDIRSGSAKVLCKWKKVCRRNTLKLDVPNNIQQVCATVKCVKYLYKYVYKGHDSARMVFESDKNDALNYNEVKQFMDMRFVTSHEGFWRINQYDLDAKMHAVIRLDLHLPDDQSVYWVENKDDVGKMLDNVERNNTMLTSFFEINANIKANIALLPNLEKRKTDGEKLSMEEMDIYNYLTEYKDFSNYFYYQIPEHYTWDKILKKWKKRSKSAKPCIGRLSYFSPQIGELFYLRLLLINIKGITSFEELLSYGDDNEKIKLDGEKNKKFQESAAALGLLDSEIQWEKYFEEAVSFQMPHALIQLFVTIALLHDDRVDVKNLWENNKKYLTDAHTKNGEYTPEQAEDLVKIAIEKALNVAGKSLANFGIELPKNIIDPVQNWDKNEEFGHYEKFYETMNDRQKQIVSKFKEKWIIKETGNLQNGCMLIDGPGGSGKTYVYETLCHYMRSQGIKYKTSSWMGIAANLLPDGRTMHNTFGLKFEMDKNSTCRAKHNDKVGIALKNSDVFIVDEISMVPNYALEMIDKKLRELCDPNKPFGGKIFIVGGDFRQTLPIKKNGGRSEIVSLSLKMSKLWKYFEHNVYRLIENKRAVKNPQDNANVPDQMDFAQYLLKMGDGKLPTDDQEYIQIPKQCVVKGDLIDNIFGKFIKRNMTIKDFENMRKRVILACKNEKVNEINDIVLNRLASVGNKMKSYQSVDKADPNEADSKLMNEYLMDEWLYELYEAGLPPHILTICKECAVMLLRNLNPDAGLMNGTRLRVLDMTEHVLYCETINNKVQTQVLIPRITLTSKNLPFTLSRKQFPVKPCFAMTVNKSQGQTIDFVGIDFTEPVFSHGMAYVAFSRVRSWDCVKVKVDESKGENLIKNIVWKEVLLPTEEDTPVEL